MKNQTIPAWVNGTFLEEILNSEIPEFTESSTPVEDGETVLDEMSEGEKILWALREKFRKIGKEKIKDETITSEDDSKYNTLDRLFWLSVCKRFPNHTRFGIRSGYKVVTFPEKEDEGCGLPEGLLEAMFGGRGGGVMMVGIGRK